MISSSANLQVAPAPSDRYVTCGITIRVACLNKIFNYGILAYSEDFEHLLNILRAVTYNLVTLLDVKDPSIIIHSIVNMIIEKRSGLLVVSNNKCSGINVKIRSLLYDKDVKNTISLKKGTFIIKTFEGEFLGVVLRESKSKDLQCVTTNVGFYDCVLYDIGLVRENNEDSGIIMSIDMRYCDERMLIIAAAVADGVGGLEYGERASYIAIRNLATYTFIEDDPRTILEKAIRSAHLEIQEYSVHVGKASATTFTGMILINNTLHLAHVGDSSAYILNNVGIIKLCTEHATDNMLTQALGFKIDKIEHVGPITLPENSLIILATDGLTKVIRPDELVTYIDRKNLEKTCKEIHNEIIRRGAPDNTTLIMLKLEKEIK